MKKIIAAFDGFKFSESTMNYAIQIAKMSNAHLVGIFLDDFSYTGYTLKDLAAKQGAFETVYNSYNEKDILQRGRSAMLFEDACKKEQLGHTIRHDRNIAIKELLHESIYADLIIIDKTETLTRSRENMPTGFIRHLLAAAHCPVLVVPNKIYPIQKVVFLFDEDPVSVHALKMYSYLLSDLLVREAVVVNLRNDGAQQVPEKYLLKELMKRHFQGVEYKVINAPTGNELVNYLRGLAQNVVVVAGAYNRSGLSRWLRPSMADDLMRTLRIPVFIAHH